MNITSKDGCWSVREVLTELFRQRHALSHKWRSSCGRRHLTEATDGRRGFCYGEIVAVASTVVVVIGAGSSWYHCSAAHLFFSFFQSGMPAQGWCGPHLRWVFPPQWDITEDALADILRSVLLAWVQIQQRWQPRLTVLVMEKIKLDILGYSINYMKKAVLGLLIPKTE